MTDQLAFPDAPPHTKARPGQPDTSHEQARRSRVGLRQVVAALLRSAGACGLTDDELFDLGHVADSGRRVQNRDGNECAVWVWVSDEPRAENPAGQGTGAAQEGATPVPDSTPLLHRHEHYCRTCGLTVGHWAGCPNDASRWTGDDRVHALFGGWVR
jgi:hypothetical protein